MSQSQAWKDLERRVCRALGAQRRPSVGPRGWATGSDDDGTAPFAVEVKRTKVAQLRGAWLAQARRNAKADGRPWLIAIGTHRSPRIIAVLDFDTVVALARAAGMIRHTDKEGDAMLHETPQPPTDPPPEEEGDGDDGDETT